MNVNGNGKYLNHEKKKDCFFLVSQKKNKMKSIFQFRFHDFHLSFTLHVRAGVIQAIAAPNYLVILF